MIANLEPRVPGSSGATYHLKVTLIGAKPSIWRRLRVPGNDNLGWLHAVLQVAMGWTNSHLHHFLTSEARYSDPRCNEDIGLGDTPDRDESKATLASVAPLHGTEFVYEYDFGDSWEHLVTVEQILEPDPAGERRAVCTGGARACPPEDCGGVWGFGDLLKIIKNPKHREHEPMMEWLGGEFDPAAFSLEQLNPWLAKLKWPRVTEAQLRKVLMARDGYQE
jgi:hypothetical protein